MNPTEEELQEEIEAQKRREIRQKQRALQEDVHEVKALMGKVDQAKFGVIRNLTNDIFVTITHPREQQYDALLFKDLSVAAKTQSNNLADSAHQFDLSKLSSTLTTKYKTHNDFSWGKLGLDLGSMNSGIPTFETMLGPLSKEIKARKVAVRRERDNMNMSAEKPEEISQEADDADEATNERLKALHKLINEKTMGGGDDEDEEDGGEGVKPFDLFRLLIDPQDHVQTVENFFDFSFLIKDKLVVMDVDAVTGMPVAVSMDQNKMAEAAATDAQAADDKSQMILSIGMRDLAAFAHLLYPDGVDGDEAHPLHRSDPLYGARDATEQADLIQRAHALQAEEKRRRAQTQPGSSGGGGKAMGASRGRGGAGAGGVSRQRANKAAQQPKSSSSSSSSSSFSPDFSASPAAVKQPSSSSGYSGRAGAAAASAPSALGGADDGRAESPTTTSSTHSDAHSGGGRQQENITPPHRNVGSGSGGGNGGLGKRVLGDNGATGAHKPGRAETSVLVKRQKS